MQALKQLPTLLAQAAGVSFTLFVQNQQATNSVPKRARREAGACSRAVAQLLGPSSRVGATLFRKVSAGPAARVSATLLQPRTCAEAGAQRCGRLLAGSRGVGGPQQRPPCRHCILTFQLHRDHRPAGHELCAQQRNVILATAAIGLPEVLRCMFRVQWHRQ